MRRLIEDFEELRLAPGYSRVRFLVMASFSVCAALLLAFGISVDSWIGEPSWSLVLIAFVPVAAVLFPLALFCRRAWSAFAIGLLAGSVLLIPFAPYNEWKEINLRARKVQVGMSPAQVCSILGEQAPDCMADASDGSVVVRHSDPDEAAYVAYEFSAGAIVSVRSESD